ncbi:hypothetical protein SEA_SICARIUS2_48 [Arthrobacter phage Sicarius2]|uniref:Uncharacterized protein n=1 Tax=Arthrobacter phage Sicarius2 TaxID=2836090 RepID=A0A8F3INJ0_9CAUD|nr:hypothetical protein SEA_SICARIUS2_48 [Arthrobacter phage Sicarius2]
MSDIEQLTKTVDGDTISWAFTDAEGIDFEIKHIKASGVISIHEIDTPGIESLQDSEPEQQIAINAIDAPKVIAALQAALQLAAESGVYRYDDA